MQAFTQNLQKTTQSFVKSDPSSLPEILAIFVGGIRIYRKHDGLALENEPSGPNHDGLLVVPTKHDIYQLFNDPQRRQLLTKIVGIVKEENADFEVPSPSSSLWSEFDAVQLKGYNENGDEKSVKIFNLMDDLCKETTNALCSKHGRVCEEWQIWLGAVSRHNPKTVLDEIPTQSNDCPITRLSEDTSISSSESTSDKAMTAEGGETLFKEAPLAEDKKYNAELAAKFFPRVVIPRVAAKGELFYRFFRISTKSDVRLSYIRGQYKDKDIAQRLLHAETVQAEDTLRAYRQSLSLTNSGRNDPTDAPPRGRIQQLFRDRLLDDSWMRLRYGQGVDFHNIGQFTPLDEVLTLRWRINGKCYGTLKDAFDYAREVLAPESPYLQTCPVVFGLGKYNILLPEAFNKKGGSDEVVYTDTDTSGFDSVMLDLASPLYVDNMFDMVLDRDMLFGVSHGEIIFDLSYQPDDVTQGIRRIKKNNLIKPLCEEVQRLGGNLEDHVPLLAVALFLCTTVSEDYSSSPIDFIESFALGLVFLRARTFEELDSCFQTLGFSE